MYTGLPLPVLRKNVVAVGLLFQAMQADAEVSVFFILALS